MRWCPPPGLTACSRRGWRLCGRRRAHEPVGGALRTPERRCRTGRPAARLSWRGGALHRPAGAGDGPLPLLVIGRPEQETNLDVQDVRLARLGVVLTAYARQEAPAEEVDAPLRRARRLLEGADFAWPGGELAALTCRGPLAAPAERPWRAARLEVEGLYFTQPEGGSTP
ncbi:hypothetical protein [Fodinicurvata halophila]|uniref:hypothetical protein n=1 Tax=Fodinicurvata halophila TaxID=1419723 RepID=UPI003628CA39